MALRLASPGDSPETLQAKGAHNAQVLSLRAEEEIRAHELEQVLSPLRQALRPMMDAPPTPDLDQAAQFADAFWDQRQGEQFAPWILTIFDRIGLRGHLRSIAIELAAEVLVEMRSDQVESRISASL